MGAWATTLPRPFPNRHPVGEGDGLSIGIQGAAALLLSAGPNPEGLGPQKAEAGVDCVSTHVSNGDGCMHDARVVWVSFHPSSHDSLTLHWYRESRPEEPSQSKSLKVASASDKSRTFKVPG